MAQALRDRAFAAWLANAAGAASRPYRPDDLACVLYATLLDGEDDVDPPPLNETGEIA